MSYSAIEAFMRHRGELLLSGQIDALAASYMFPLPVFMAEAQVVVHTPQRASAMLCLQRISMIRRGVFAIQPRIAAIELPRNGRFRVWVDWLETAIPVQGTRRGSAVYYCSSQPSGLKIEMVNYTRMSVPELQPQFLALALSA